MKDGLNEGMVYLIHTNLKEIVKQVLSDISEFNHSNRIKLQAMKQLLHIVVIAQNKIKPFIEDILKIVYKNLFLYEEIEFIEIVFFYLSIPR